MYKNDIEELRSAMSRGESSATDDFWKILSDSDLTQFILVIVVL